MSTQSAAVSRVNCLSKTMRVRESRGPIRSALDDNIRSSTEDRLGESQYYRPHARMELNTFKHLDQAILERAINALK